MSETRGQGTPPLLPANAAAEEAERAARIRRSAWALAALAVFFYVGFIAWNAIRGPIG